MSLIKSSKLQKRNKRPKQIKHWIYRLGGKSSGKLISDSGNCLFIHRRFAKSHFFFSYKDIFVDMCCYPSGNIELEFFELDTINTTLFYFKIFKVSCLDEFKQELDKNLELMYLERL